MIIETMKQVLLSPCKGEDPREFSLHQILADDKTQLFIEFTQGGGKLGAKNVFATIKNAHTNKIMGFLICNDGALSFEAVEGREA